MNNELINIIKHIADIDEISKIVYRNDNFEVARFRHIDIEYIYGDFAEITEDDEIYKRILSFYEQVDLEQEEVILFEVER